MHTRQSVTLSEESEALTFWRCDGKGFDERMGADFSSPDAVLFVAVGTPYLAAGDDGETPSIVLEFGVNGLVGQFVIDTTCVTPNNHLLFVNDEFASFTPDFTMDTITIGDCGCPCFGDPQCDSVPTVLDIVHTLNVAFRGYSAVFDEGCAWKRTDTDHSGFTNVLDVVAVVNVAFRDLSNCSENWAKGCD